MHRARRPALSATVFTVASGVLVASGNAGAQQPAHTGAASTGSDAPAAYQGLVDNAVSEFDAGHWEEARALFLEAHRVYPNARTLRGIGMASYELRDYPEAARALDSALLEPRRALTDEQRAQVTVLLGNARRFLGQFTVPAAPAGSTLWVDGHATALSGRWPATSGLLLLGLGDHEVAIHDTEGHTTSARVTVRGREESPLALDLALLQPSSANNTASSHTDNPADPRPDGPGDTLAPHPPPSLPGWEPSHRSNTPWIVLGIGAGATVVGIVLLAVGGVEGNGVAQVDPAMPHPAWSERAFAYDSAPWFTGVGTGLLCAGLGTALVGLIWGAGQPAAHTDTSAHLRVGPGSLGIEGRF